MTALIFILDFFAGIMNLRKSLKGIGLKYRFLLIFQEKLIIPLS